jgi:hypothetical protein
VPKRDPKSPRGMDDLRIVGRRLMLVKRVANGYLVLFGKN